METSMSKIEVYLKPKLALVDDKIQYIDRDLNVSPGKKPIVLAKDMRDVNAELVQEVYDSAKEKGVLVYDIQLDKYDIPGSPKRKAIARYREVTLAEPVENIFRKIRIIQWFNLENYKNFKTARTTIIKWLKKKVYSVLPADAEPFAITCDIAYGTKGASISNIEIKAYKKVEAKPTKKGKKK